MLVEGDVVKFKKYDGTWQRAEVAYICGDHVQLAEYGQAFGLKQLKNVKYRKLRPYHRFRVGDYVRYGRKKGLITSIREGPSGSYEYYPHHLIQSCRVLIEGTYTHYIWAIDLTPLSEEQYLGIK